jgi:sulfate permease, SulP family
LPNYLLPKFIGLQKILAYDRAWWRGDLLAGITVAAYLTPQCLAHAELAGLPPATGLWAVILPFLIYALLGSSPQLSIGSESGISLLTATALASLTNSPSQTSDLAALLALLVGAICLVGYGLRLGFLANLLSKPILVGYMTGVSLLMMAGQGSNLTGINTQSETVLGSLAEVIQHLGVYHWPTLAIGLVVLGLLFSGQKLAPAFPFPLVAVSLATAAVAIGNLEQAGVAVVGAIPAGLPRFGLPQVSISDIQSLLLPALGIAVVGYSDNVLTARAFASRNGYGIAADQELLALGMANLSNGLTHGFAISSSASRTALSESAGGKTQMYAIVAVIVVILELLFLRPVLALFPKAALGALLIFAATRLIDIPEFIRLYKFRRSEFGLAMITLGGVVFTDITLGVVIAIGLSILELLWRILYPQVATIMTETNAMIYRYSAPLCFANAEDLRDRISKEIIGQPQLQKLILEIQTMPQNDITAIDMLAELTNDLHDRGITIEINNIDRALDPITTNPQVLIDRHP